jgi:hypothetical protein
LLSERRRQHHSVAQGVRAGDHMSTLAQTRKASADRQSDVRSVRSPIGIRGDGAGGCSLSIKRSSELSPCRCIADVRCPSSTKTDRAAGFKTFGDGDVVASPIGRRTAAALLPAGLMPYGPSLLPPCRASRASTRRLSSSISASSSGATGPPNLELLGACSPSPGSTRASPKYPSARRSATFRPER